MASIMPSFKITMGSMPWESAWFTSVSIVLTLPVRTAAAISSRISRTPLPWSALRWESSVTYSLRTFQTLRQDFLFGVFKAAVELEHVTAAGRAGVDEEFAVIHHLFLCAEFQ
jgi:hypothetical protein